MKGENFVSCLTLEGLWEIWEMTRNLGAHPALLSRPTISKFSHLVCLVIIPQCKNIAISAMAFSLHNLKILQILQHVNCEINSPLLT